MKNERPLVKDMKTQNVETIHQRSFLVAAAVVGMLLFSFTTQGFGQKEQAERATTRDGLSTAGFMTNPEISDDIDGTEDEYFYKFQAVPGKLTVTVEVTANETNAGAMLDLFGPNSRAILSNVLVQAANGGSERVSRTVNISKKQDVIIRIKGLRYGSSSGYPGTYKIVLEGAVSFNVAVPSDVPVQNTTPVPPGGAVQDTPSVPSDVPVQTNTPIASDAAVQTNTPVASDASVQSNTPAASDTPVQDKKPNKADRVIEKAKSKSEKLLRALDIVREKKPN